MGQTLGGLSSCSRGGRASTNGSSSPPTWCCARILCDASWPTSAPGGLYRFGSYQQLVGRRVEDLGPIGQARGRALLDPMQRIFPIGDEDELVPVRVSAVIKLPAGVRQRLHAAVAVGGVIQTLVAAPRLSRSRRLAATIPEEAVRNGRAKAELYLVTGSGGSPSLERLRAERSSEPSRWRW